MTRRFDHLPDVEIFAAVAQHGSMSAAAVALGTTPSVISRALTRLEARLGCQLMRRTTRRIRLTDAGERYLAQTQAALAQIDDIERELQGQTASPAGRVRLSAPTTYGHHRLPALLAPFVRRYPRVELELNISNRNVDLAAEGFDLAVRLGPPPERALVARHLEDARLCLVAAPAYLAQASTPQDLETLAAHRCLPFIMPSTGRITPWLLRVDGHDVDWLPSPGLTVSDDVLGTVSLAEQGLGICQTYDFIARERLRDGRLVELLPGLRGRSRAFSLIYAPQRQPSATVRLLIDALVGAARAVAETGAVP